MSEWPNFFKNFGHPLRPLIFRRISSKTYVEAACERGLLNTVRSFISNGCKLNSRCSTGYSLLHSALSHQKLDVASLLVNFGCDVESRVALGAGGEVLDDGDEVEN